MLVWKVFCLPQLKFAISVFSPKGNKRKNIATTFHFYLSSIFCVWFCDSCSKGKAENRPMCSSAWVYTWVHLKGHLDSHCQWWMWFPNKDRRPHLQHHIASGRCSQCRRQILKKWVFFHLLCCLHCHKEKKIGHLFL